MEKKEYPWLSTLLSYFKTIKEYDTQIESLRSSLCSNPNFSSLSLFSYLDKDLKSFLTLNDFKSFLSSQNISYDENKLRKLIHNFDKDNDFCLNLHEFSSLIQSKRKNQKNEFLSNYNKEINEEMISDLKNILEKEMELITELNEMAKEIKNSEIFSTYEAFTVIVGKDKYITKKNFGKFLNDNFMEVSEEDANNIMFRIDADNDDKISYEEFKEIFYPIKEDYSSINNKYENNNNNNIDIASKYLNIEEEKENNNFENNEEQNQDNFEDIKKDEEEEKDDKVIEEDNNVNPNKKKKKTTKKVILKPKLKTNINPESESNLLHSPYTRSINENNTNIYKSKCTSCGVPKKDTNINNNLVNKYNIEPENENVLNNYQEEKNINTNILRGKNNNNNIPNNEYNHDHKSGKCKACQYTAKNIYTDLRIKNSNNSPLTSSDKFNFNKIEESENIIEENNYNNINDNKNEYNELDINDIYKNKDELLKKYGINSGNENNLNHENEIDFTEFNFSTQKKYKPIKEVNDNLEPIQEIENNKTVFKSKKIISSNNNNNYFQEDNSSNFISSNSRKNIIPKNNINEKKELLFKLFVDYIEKENDLEKIKQSLLSCQDATPQNVFNLFNINNSNKISCSDILETLNSLSSNESFELDDIKYIFKKYNKTTSNGFTLEELNNIVFSNQNSSNNEEVKLEDNTKNIICELFKEIIEGEKVIENSRNLLEQASNNIFYDIFESIKKENMSGIEKDDIEKLLKENGYDIKDNDIEIIMEKMDKNRDSLIDYGEFIGEIRPMNFC